jgi:hypothetical protein
MPHRKIESAHLPLGAKGDANAAEVSAAERPAGSHVGSEPIISCLCIKRNDTGAA